MQVELPRKIVDKLREWISQRKYGKFTIQFEAGKPVLFRYEETDKDVN